ncbi:MAG: ribosome maturation factor RimP [Desulfovibrio sp.]|nr:ribosome maturation factor RimP [Desulfovibrio sp.]
MTEETLKKNILALAGPVVLSMNLIIWGLKILRSDHMIIRLYVDVDTPQPSHAVPDAVTPFCGTDAGARPLSPSIGQCEEISRHLALSLEVEDLIAEAYVLEVSTPGFSRIFFNLAQMRPYLGDMLEIKLHNPIIPELTNTSGVPPAVTPRRLWCGRLEAVENDVFVLEPAVISADGDILSEAFRPLTLSWDNVRKANCLHIFKSLVKPGKKSKTGTIRTMTLQSATFQSASHTANLSDGGTQ